MESCCLVVLDKVCCRLVYTAILSGRAIVIFFYYRLDSRTVALPHSPTEYALPDRCPKSSTTL